MLRFSTFYQAFANGNVTVQASLTSMGVKGHNYLPNVRINLRGLNDCLCRPYDWNTQYKYDTLDYRNPCRFKAYARRAIVSEWATIRLLIMKPF